MRLSPRNKRVIVERVVSEEQKESDTYLSSFMLEAKAKKQFSDIYTVIDVADDCTIGVRTGDMILVEGNMVEESKTPNFTFLSVKENFVIGVLKE